MTIDEGIANDLAAIRAGLDDIEQGVLDRDRGVRGRLTVFELVRQACRRTRDSYPAKSSFREPGNTTVIRDVTDSGEVEYSVPPVSDPAGNAAMPDEHEDPLRLSLQEIVRSLRLARREVRRAVTELVKAQPPLLNEEGEPGCIVHARIVDDIGGEKRRRWVPRADKGDGRQHERCSWCHRWWISESEDPAEALVRAHDEGRKLTTKLVAELTRKGPTRPQNRKR